MRHFNTFPFIYIQYRFYFMFFSETWSFPYIFRVCRQTRFALPFEFNALEGFEPLWLRDSTRATARWQRPVGSDGAKTRCFAALSESFLERGLRLYEGLQMPSEMLTFPVHLEKSWKMVYLFQRQWFNMSWSWSWTFFATGSLNYLNLESTCLSLTSAGSACGSWQTISVWIIFKLIPAYAFGSSSNSCCSPLLRLLCRYYSHLVLIKIFQKDPEHWRVGLLPPSLT